MTAISLHTGKTIKSYEQLFREMAFGYITVVFIPLLFSRSPSKTVNM